MLHKLRRWHFDLALFLGLAIFSWAYWYSKPRPVWTSYYTLKDNAARTNHFTLLGYSADSQSIYTTCENYKLSNNWPFPQIQRWSTKTGELLEDFALQMPEEDRFQLQLPVQRFTTPYTITLCNDTRHMLLRYQQSKQKDHHYLRLYRLDGKPVGQGLDVYRFDRVECLTDSTGGDRHWVVRFELNWKKVDMPMSVVDLDTGKPVRDPRTYLRPHLDVFPTVVAGRYLNLNVKPALATSMQMEIVDLMTGETLGNIPLPSGKMHQWVRLNDTHYAVYYAIGEFESYITHLDMYRYDQSTRTFVPDHSHPLDGLTSASMQWLSVLPPYLLTTSINQDTSKESEILKVIRGWLARIGIVRNHANTINYQIADMTTGQRLRQISGIPSEGDHTASPDWCSIAAIATHNEKYEPGLCLYVIPHHLWEPTLSWLQWLAWLLVIPWPFRYFLPTHLAPGSSSRGAI